MQKFRTSTQFAELVAGLVIVLLVTIVGAAIALQGWKSRIPFVDLTPPIDDAINILGDGVIPRWGRANSLGTYASPGSSWLLLPGPMLFSDPRLFEYGGAIILYFGTMVGVFLFARLLFNFRCAAFSVILYGFSELGLYFAQSLWPKGHPFFYIWTAYFIALWVKRNSAWYMAAALITSMAGIYVHMEISPILIIIPLVGLLYRCQLRLIPTLVGVAICLVIWFPYLIFEYDRAFYDIIAQLLQYYDWDNYKSAWCNPHSTLMSIGGSRGVPPYQTIATGHLIFDNLVLGLLGNFHRSLRVIGVPVVLFSFTITSLIIIVLPTLWKPKLLGRVPGPRQQGLVALLLTVPWGLLLCVTVNARYLVETRFWWLWPVQIIMMAALVADSTLRKGLRSAVARGGQALLVLLVLANPLLIERTKSWIADGWSGHDSYEKETVDYIAGLVIGEGRREASIGYEISFNSWLPMQHIADNRMKVGMEFDLLFRLMHEIRNKTRCAEGVSPNDEYRIVQTEPSAALTYPFNFIDGLARTRVKLADQEKFETVKRFGPYLVQERKHLLN